MLTMDDMLQIVKPHNDKIVAEYKLADAEREIERLRAEVELWRDRCESLVADMQAMERGFDEAWNRDRS